MLRISDIPISNIWSRLDKQAYLDFDTGTRIVFSTCTSDRLSLSIRKLKYALSASTHVSLIPGRTPAFLPLLKFLLSRHSPTTEQKTILEFSRPVPTMSSISEQTLRPSIIEQKHELVFIVSGSKGKPGLNARHLIRSHVMRGKNRRKGAADKQPRLGSWINRESSQPAGLYLPVPLHIGSALPLTQFAYTMPPYALDLIFKCEFGS